MAKRMTPEEDAVMFELVQKGLTLREISRQTGRNHRSVSNAVARHEARAKDARSDTGEFKAYRRWLNQGRGKGWDAYLRGGIE